MKKILKISLVVVAAATIGFYAFTYLYWHGVFCSLAGGKVFYDLKRICESKAKDGGKNCIYDNECSKGFCFYPPSSEMAYPDNLSAGGGHCAAYKNEHVSGVCHRNRGDRELERILYGAAGQVTCETWVF